MAKQLFGTLNEHFDELLTQYELFGQQVNGPTQQQAREAYWVEELTYEQTAGSINQHQFDVEFELNVVINKLYDLDHELQLDPDNDDKLNDRRRLLRQMQRLHMLRKVVNHIDDEQTERMYAPFANKRYNVASD